MKSIKLLIVVGAAVLAGCTSTVGELVRKTDQTLDSLSTNGKPLQITKFQAQASAEQALLSSMMKQAKLQNQTWWYAERTVKVKARNLFRNEIAVTVPIANGFRIALPQDALDLRIASVQKVIHEMALLIERRSEWDESMIYISANEEATSQWIASLVTAKLKNKGFSVAQEFGPPSIGWISTGLAERQLGAE